MSTVYLWEIAAYGTLGAGSLFVTMYLAVAFIEILNNYHMKETVIERYLVAQVKKAGGKALKMVPTYDNGIPDRLVLLHGKTIFVELKAPGEEPRKLQALFLDELRRGGYDARVIDTKKQVDDFIKEIQNTNKS
jgi:hypothetical protein